MNTEQKAEAYDKALDRARKIHKYSSDLAEIKRMEDIFPELAESEDEKIRKSLLRWLQSNSYTSIAGIQINDVIAWLERQCGNKEINETSYRTGIKRVLDNPEFYGLKKQSEQKPVIIIPKFRVGDEVITENEGSLTITRIDEEGYWSNDLFICDFASECVWDLVKRKPTEWKQENREELTEFENAMMHIGGSFFGENAGLDPNDTAVIKEQAELLLELVPKTEWSEEDKEMFDYALDMVEWYDGKNKKRVRLVSNWLKSLKQRHTWKPSEEQMEVLVWCRPLFVAPKLKGILESLINDLKKLKGE